MLIMDIRTQIIAALSLVYALLLTVLGFGYGPWAAHQQGMGEARVTTSYNAAINQQKATAGQLLATETQKAATATKALHDSQAQREIDDAKNASTVAALAVRLRAVGVAGRLRDPNAAGCGGSGGGAQGADPARAGGGAADTAEAGGLFSAGATELFQRLTSEADNINIAYASCRADALNVREVMQ